MLNYLKKNKKIVIGVIIFLFLLIIIVNKNKDDSGIVRDTVLRGDVSSVITLSGKVEASENVSLRFPNSGTIAGVYAKEGDFVKEGDNLLELDNRSLWADLLRAEAGLELQIAETKVSSAETDIDVENAYIDLLNNDLRAYPKNENSDYTVSAPIVSGSFLGKKEGEYNIEVYSSKSSSGASFRYSGIEGNGSGTVIQYSASRLGDLGLYLEFNEDENYQNTDWVIPIPNNRSSTYSSALNAYNSALASRDASESGNISSDIANAKIKQSRAEVAKIQAEIGERTIRAPFAGTVSYVGVNKGEFAGTSDDVISLISLDNYEIKIQIPEVDLLYISKDMLVQINLDAYPEEVFNGYVYSVDPAETSVEGVSVYEAVIYFNEQNPKIKSGMTASAKIVSDKKEDVLVVKKQFIEKDELGEFVTVYEEEKEIKTYIKTGMVGSDGSIEIVSGLKEGDVIIGRFE